MLAGWGRGRGEAGVKGTEKGKGQARENERVGYICAEVISPLKDDRWHGTGSERQDVQEEKTWGTLGERSLYPWISRIATGRRSF